MIKKLFDKFQHFLITEKAVANNTVLAYQRDITQFLQHLEQKYAIQSYADVKLDHVKSFLRSLRYKKVGPKSASRKLSALKTFANYLETYHDFQNFTLGVTFPKLPKRLPKHLSFEHVQAMFEEAQHDQTATGQRNKVILYLLYACGLRVSELTNLKVSNISFDEQLLQISGKGGKQRLVPLPPDMMKLFNHYLTSTHAEFSIAAQNQEQQDILFPVKHKGKLQCINRDTVLNFIKKNAIKAGIMHNVSPHTLRHSLATHLLKKGANLRILQMLLGHEQLSTVQMYTHLDITHLKELYEKFHPRAQK